MLPSAASRSRLGLLCAPAATSGRYDRDLHCVKKHPPVGICFGPSSSLVDAGAIQTLPHSRGTSDMLPLCGPLPVLGRGARAGRPSRSRGYPAVKPVLRFVVPQAGRISKLEGVPPGVAQAALPATARGRVKLLSRAITVFRGLGPRLGACFQAGRLSSGRAGSVASAVPQAGVHSDPGNSAARHMPSCGNLHARARTAAWWATVGFAENGGCAGSGPSPRDPTFRRVLGVFPSRRSAYFRSLEIYQTPYTPLCREDPAHPQLPHGLRASALRDPQPLARTTAGPAEERNRMFLFPTHASSLTSR